MQTNISSVLQNFTDSYRGSYQNNGMRSISPVKQMENNEDIPLVLAPKEPHVKITSDSTDIKQRKKDMVNNLSTLTPFYMAKIKANANIRMPVATPATYLSGRNSVNKHYQTVNVAAIGGRNQCKTSTQTKENQTQANANEGVGYRTRNKRNVVSQARDAIQQYTTATESRNMSSTVEGDGDKSTVMY